jgi:hypothetical protein
VAPPKKSRANPKVSIANSISESATPVIGASKRAAKKPTARSETLTGYQLVRGRKAPKSKVAYFEFVKLVRNSYNKEVNFPKEEMLDYLVKGQKLSTRHSKKLLKEIVSYVDNLCDNFNDAAEEAQNPIQSKEMPSSLPEEAPELFKGNRGGKKGGEPIDQFLRRVWGRYMEAGLLTRSDLKRLDMSAYQGLSNWLRTNELPEDIKIPTKSEAIDAEYGIQNLSIEEIKAQMLEHARLSTILRQRLKALERE